MIEIGLQYLQWNRHLRYSLSQYRFHTFMRQLTTFNKPIMSCLIWVISVTPCKHFHLQTPSECPFRRRFIGQSQTHMRRKKIRNDPLVSIYNIQDVLSFYPTYRQPSSKMILSWEKYLIITMHSQHFYKKPLHNMLRLLKCPPTIAYIKHNTQQVTSQLRLVSIYFYSSVFFRSHMPPFLFFIQWSMVEEACKDNALSVEKSTIRIETDNNMFFVLFCRRNVL